MTDDRLWALTVAIGLSSLLLLTYFISIPFLNKEGIVEHTKEGLSSAISNFDTIRDEIKDNPVLILDDNT